MRSLLSALTALIVLGLSSSARAVTIEPFEALIGTTRVFDIAVPTDNGFGSVVKVEVKIPQDIAYYMIFEDKPGWRREVAFKQLDEPVVVEGLSFTAVPETVEWSGGKSGPGEFTRFTFYTETPQRPVTVEFDVKLTYSSGDVIRWASGTGDPLRPAPFISFFEFDLGQGVLATLQRVQKAQLGVAQPVTPESVSEEGADNRLPIALGLIGAVTGITALVLQRKKPPPPQAKRGR